MDKVTVTRVDHIYNFICSGCCKESHIVKSAKNGEAIQFRAAMATCIHCGITQWVAMDWSLLKVDESGCTDDDDDIDWRI